MSQPEAPKRGRGRPPTGGDKRTIRLPADMLPLWDDASTDVIREILREGLRAKVKAAA